MSRRFAPSVLVVLLCSWACDPSPDQAAPSADEISHRPNIIIALVDTLRADHMSLHGYHRATTPHIEDLAADGVVFERARAQAGCTFPSVNSLLTSRYPGLFNRQGEGEMGIPADIVSLPEILQAAGYHTIAVSASPIVRATPSKNNPGGGFDRGFDVFDERSLWRDAAAVNSRVRKALADAREPFFLYIHYMDPHAYYQPPESHERLFAVGSTGKEFIDNGDPNPIAKMLYSDGPEVEVSDRDLDHLIALYDDEILYFDGAFSALMASLRASGLDRRSIVALVADHGEEFLEHGHVGHCRGVWDTLTWTPMVLWAPGLQPRRVPDTVGNIDLAPTLLELAAIDREVEGFEGRSLVPMLEGAGPGPEFTFADQSRYRAVDDGRHQLVLDGVEKTVALYDLAVPPGDQADLYTPSHPQVDRLGGALNDWLKATRQWVRFDEALAASKRKQEELRALGYLE